MARDKKGPSNRMNLLQLENAIQTVLKSITPQVKDNKVNKSTRFPTGLGSREAVVKGGTFTFNEA